MTIEDNGFTYHILLATVKDNLCPAFGVQDAIDQSGMYIVIDCRQNEDFETAHLDLMQYVPFSYPDWITSVCAAPLNATHAEAHALISTEGNAGEAWQKPFEAGNP